MRLYPVFPSQPVTLSASQLLNQAVSQPATQPAIQSAIQSANPSFGIFLSAKCAKSPTTRLDWTGLALSSVLSSHSPFALLLSILPALPIAPILPDS